MCAEYEQHRPALKAWSEILSDWPDSDDETSTHLFPRRAGLTRDAEGFAGRHWSLVPPWADSPKLKFSTFNARAETLRGKPVFRNAWRKGQRCLVPMSAWYEWAVLDGRKRKHRVSARDGGPIVVAGLWERWQRDEQALDSFTLVTVAATPAMASLHARMPRTLSPDDADRWLHDDPESCEPLLRTPEIEPALRIEPVADRPADPGTGQLF